MSNTYTWAIQTKYTQRQIETYSDVVIEVVWNCTGTDGTHYAVVPGSTRIEFENTDFTPYNDLTQEQVLGWIYSSGVDKASIESQVDAYIESQVNPPVVVLPLPWV